MRGLKTQESQKFNRFWQLIQDTACKINCAFFGFAGEGRDFETAEMEGEDFSGWLVPLDDVTAFEALWSNPSSTAADLQDAFPKAKFLFAIWRMNDDTVSVEFREF